MTTTLYDLILRGGWAMWPLGAVCLFTLFLIFQASFMTRRTRFCLAPKYLMTCRQYSNCDEAFLASLTSSASGRMLAAAWERRRQGRISTEERIAELADNEESQVGAWIQYLNVCANIAPMIGLLGTVSGMIGAFKTLSTSGMGKPELLAGDIGEALITTAAGLVIAIPAMVAFYFLRNRLAAGVRQAIQESLRVLDNWESEGFYGNSSNH